MSQSQNSSNSQKRSFQYIQKKDIPESEYFTLVPNKKIEQNEEEEQEDNDNNMNESQPNDGSIMNESANENANNPSFQIHSMSPQINPSLLYLSSNNELETRHNEIKPTEEKEDEYNIEEKYKQEILEQCIANQNEQKEKFIEEKLKQKISQKMKKTLYQDEYKVVYERIKREVQQKITNDFIAKKKKEVDIQKKKIEYNTQSKLIDFKNKLYMEYKQQSDEQKLNIVKEKEKEIEEKCKADLAMMKEKIKRDLIAQYQNKENELIKELEEAKENLVIQKEKEKKRLEQLNKIKSGYLIEEEFQKEKNKQIESMIDNYKNYELNNSKNNISANSGLKRKTSYQNFNKTPKVTTGLKKMKSVQKLNNNSNKTKSNPFNMIGQERTSVNLKEVNNRIKYSTPRSAI